MDVLLSVVGVVVAAWVRREMIRRRVGPWVIRRTVVG